MDKRSNRGIKIMKLRINIAVNSLWSESYLVDMSKVKDKDFKDAVECFLNEEEGKFGDYEVVGDTIIQKGSVCNDELATIRIPETFQVVNVVTDVK